MPIAAVMTYILYNGTVNMSALTFCESIKDYCWIHCGVDGQWDRNLTDNNSDMPMTTNGRCSVASYFS